MTSDESRPAPGSPVAERLFRAFREIAPYKRRPGFGHPSRPGEFQLLHLLSHEPPGSGARLVDLASWLGVKPPSVSQLVDALAARGLAERYADEADRRVIRVRLSGAGRDMAASFYAQGIKETEALADYLGAEDAESLARILTRTVEFFASRYGRPECRHRAGAHTHDKESDRI